MHQLRQSSVCQARGNSKGVSQNLDHENSTMKTQTPKAQKIENTKYEIPLKSWQEPVISFRLTEPTVRSAHQAILALRSGRQPVLVVDTRSVGTTIAVGQNMQICHSLRCKQNR